MPGVAKHESKWHAEWRMPHATSGVVCDERHANSVNDVVQPERFTCAGNVMIVPYEQRISEIPDEQRALKPDYVAFEKCLGTLKYKVSSRVCTKQKLWRRLT